MFNQLAVAVALASACSAALVPTGPGPNDRYNAGDPCPIQYNADTTDTWTNVTVTLMTGSNFAMVPVAPVAVGLDGTQGGTISTFTCPEVSIYGQIYFYQFEQLGEPTSWTTRFTIASPSGATVTAPERTVVGGSTIGYGTGRLVNAAATTGATANQTSSRVTASVRSTDSEASGFASIASTTLSPSATASSAAATAQSESESESESSSSTTSSTSSAAAAANASSTTNSSGAGKIFTSLTSIALAAVGIISLA